MLKLTEIRKARGWSQAELSRRTGMNQATMSQIESGHFIPYASQLAKIAQALGVDPRKAAGLMEVTSKDDWNAKRAFTRQDERPSRPQRRGAAALQ